MEWKPLRHAEELTMGRRVPGQAACGCGGGPTPVLHAGSRMGAVSTAIEPAAWPPSDVTAQSVAAGGIARQPGDGYRAQPAGASWTARGPSVRGTTGLAAQGSFGPRAGGLASSGATPEYEKDPPLPTDEIIDPPPEGPSPFVPRDDGPKQSWSSGTHRWKGAEFILCGRDLGMWGRVDQAVATYMVLRAIPSGSIAITGRSGQLVYAKGFTNLNAYEQARETAILTCPRSRFRVASISKPITAAGVVLCWQNQLLKPNDLDTTLGELGLDEYYSAFIAEAIARDTGRTSRRSTKEQLAAITLQQLLTHTSGMCEDRTRPAMQMQNFNMPLQSCNPISWYKEDEDVLDYVTGKLPVTRNQVLACAASTSITTPGFQWQYTNHAFMMLARVIEVVTGRDYESWMKENLLAPLGMFDTTIGEGDRFSGAEVPYYGFAWPWEEDALGNVVYDAVHDDAVVRDSFATTVMDTSGRRVYLPRGTRNIRAVDGGSGWVSTTLDLLRLTRDLFTFDSGQPGRTLFELGWAQAMGASYANIWSEGSRTETAYKQGLGFKVEWHRTGDLKDRGHTGHLEGTQAMLYHRGTLAYENGISTTEDAYGLAALFNRHTEGWEEYDDEDDFYTEMRGHCQGAILETGAGDLWASA